MGMHRRVDYHIRLTIISSLLCRKFQQRSDVCIAGLPYEPIDINIFSLSTANTKYCPEVPTIPNGVLPPPANLTRTIGSEVNYSCNTGYHYDERYYPIHCRTDTFLLGQWTLGFCYRKSGNRNLFLTNLVYMVGTTS